MQTRHLTAGPMPALAQLGEAFLWAWMGTRRAGFNDRKCSFFMTSLQAVGWGPQR